MGFDGERCQVIVFAKLRHNFQRRAVKSPRLNVADSGLVQTLTKFVAGFAGESHRQHVFGFNLSLRHTALNTQGENVGLAGTGTGLHQEATRGRGDGFALLGGEALELGVGEGGTVHNHATLQGGCHVAQRNVPCSLT